MSILQFGAPQLCADGSICSDENSVSNNFSYQLDCFPKNGLSFLRNNQDEEDLDDSLYLNWDDIDNYEDDDMNRSSDSTCGLGATHGDGLDWLSLSDAVGGIEDEMNGPCSDFRSQKRILENDYTLRLDCMKRSSSLSDLQESSATYKGSSWPSIKYEEPGQLGSSEIKGSSCFLVDDNSSDQGLFSISKDSSCHNFLQINEQNKKRKCEKQSGLGRKQSGLGRNQLLENDSFFFIEDISKSGQHPEQAQDSKNFGHLHSDAPYTCSVYRCSSDLTSLNQCLTAIESENVSHSLHHLYALDGEEQSMKSSSESLLPQFSPAIQSKNISHSPTKNECNGGVNMSISANADGSDARGKTESFKLDDISAGATSFRQLQLAMSPLDLRTKLCIRDSLYRLAWSAEKSQYYDSLNAGFIDDRDSMLAEGSNMNMEMETDTNPIDRSIAHLLFHRASDQSVLAG